MARRQREDPEEDAERPHPEERARDGEDDRGAPRRERKREGTREAARPWRGVDRILRTGPASAPESGVGGAGANLGGGGGGGGKGGAADSRGGGPADTSGAGRAETGGGTAEIGGLGWRRTAEIGGAGRGGAWTGAQDGASRQRCGEDRGPVRARIPFEAAIAGIGIGVRIFATAAGSGSGAGSNAIGLVTTEVAPGTRFRSGDPGRGTTAGGLSPTSVAARARMGAGVTIVEAGSVVAAGTEVIVRGAIVPTVLRTSFHSSGGALLPSGGRARDGAGERPLDVRGQLQPVSLGRRAPPLVERVLDDRTGLGLSHHDPIGGSNSSIITSAIA